MALIDKEYHNILSTILKNGRWYNDPNRKGTKRLQIPYYDFEYDLTKGFPAITTKKLYWKGIVGELLWFLSGSSDIRDLWKNNIHIWDKDWKNYRDSHINSYIENQNINYELGRIYGPQWREFRGPSEVTEGLRCNTTDQIQNLLNNLKKNPLSTSHIVTAWNSTELDKMALPPCHFGFQIMVYPLDYRERFHLNNKSDSGIYNPDEWGKEKNTDIKYAFDLVWNQRSTDLFLGAPFNISSYGLLAHIIGKITGYEPRMLRGSLRNVHLYDNAVEAAKKQLKRDTDKYSNCQLDLDKIRPMKMSMKGDIDNWLNAHKISDFKLIGYNSHPNDFNVKMLSRDD